MTKPPFPAEPTLVFAGANNLRRVQALAAEKVEAIMTSFEYIGKGHYMTKVAPLLQEWPVPLRTYLDSGVFTIVRKAGTTRIRIARSDKKAPKTSYNELVEFKDSYIAYLKEHGDFWDHIIELDVDEPEWEDDNGNKIPGLELAMQFQDELFDVVGEKLMPAWHVQRGGEGWTQMCRRFPYIAIGSDTGVASSTASVRPPMDPTILRSMVQEAHMHGVGVHYLGDTRYQTFLQAELDSADSTTWVSAGRFGQFPGPKGQSIRYTMKGGDITVAQDSPLENLIPHPGDGLARQRLDWQRTVRPIDMSRARQFRDLMEGWGINPDAILAGKQEERLQSNIHLLNLRQEEIRRARKATPIFSRRG